MKTRLTLLVAIMSALGTVSAAAAVLEPPIVTILPNLHQAREKGFHVVAGHPPFTVDFSAHVTGGPGTLIASWDFDGDGVPDSTALDPAAFTYARPGTYEASLSVRDEHGQETTAKQRIVVIGLPELPRWRHGLVAHLNRSYGLYHTDAEVERAAGMIRELGVDVVRLDLSWAAIQQTRDEYRWSDYDFLVDLAGRNGFELMPIIGFSSEWASTAANPSGWQDWLFAPPSPLDYAWFAYTAASRYAGRIKAWEIWSEPNVGIYWRPEPDPILYT